MRAILASGVAMPADKKPLVNVLMEPELLARVDDFRYSRRFKSRAAAIKYLMDWALTRNPQPSPEEVARW
jgi:hypothetical protein